MLFKLLERAFVGEGALGVELMDVDFHILEGPSCDPIRFPTAGQSKNVSASPYTGKQARRHVTKNDTSERGLKSLRPMIETFLTAFATFFAVIGPIDTAVLLASLTPNMSPAERRAISVKAVVIATIIILLFALVGQPVLTELGVSLAALQTAGGIILFMIALEMTLAKRPGPAASLSARESEEAEDRAEHHAEIAVFPLATPLLAGPGAMTSAIVLAASTEGDLSLIGAVIAAIIAVMAVTLVLLLLAQEIHHLIGVTARKVIVRVFGVLLAALAVQSIFNGLSQAHIFD